MGGEMAYYVITYDLIISELTQLGAAKVRASEVKILRAAPASSGSTSSSGSSHRTQLTQCSKR
jgi:hypothetical protein